MSMKISKKREQALYDSIHEQVMTLRIEIEGMRKTDPKSLTAEWIDGRLFWLEQAIWTEQEKFLK